MNRRWTFVLTAVSLILVVTYMAIGYYFSNVVIAVPLQDSVPPLERVLAERASGWEVTKWEQHHIESNGVSLAATFFENERDGNCAAILLHGYTGHRYTVLPYAPIFWQRGCDVLVYDARGHGESDDAFHTYGFYEKEDAASAVAWLMDKTGLDAPQIGVMGSSYGAATALQLLDVQPNLAFVIADSPYSSWRDIVTYQGVAQYGKPVTAFIPPAIFWVEQRADLTMDAVSPKTAVHGKETPILLLHARFDNFTPSSHSEEIFTNSNSAVTELYLTEWSPDHGTPFHGNSEGYVAIIDHFLSEKAPLFGQLGE